MTKILISLPKDFLEEINHSARVERLSRSELIRQALRHYLHRGAEQKVPRKLDPSIRRALQVQESIAGQLKGHWDSAEEIRRWRDSRRR